MDKELEKQQNETQTVEDEDLQSVDLNEKPKKPKAEKVKTGEPFYKKILGVLKKLRVFIILIILGIVGYVIYSRTQEAKKLMEAMSARNMIQFEQVEKRDLTTNITATGTLVAVDKRTIQSAMKDIKITEVNCEVGSYVNEGDVLITFSDEEINRTIRELQEDIAKSEKKEALDAESKQRAYYYSYTSEATSLTNAAERVDTALKELYEACDAYGDAKRERDEAKKAWENEPDTITTTNEYGEKVTTKNTAKDSKKASYDSAEAKVSSAYQVEQQKRAAYQSAVEAQADAAGKSSNNLSTADETLELAQLSAGEATEKLKRDLEKEKKNLDNYVITAPISGIVTSLKLEPGNGFSGGEVLTIQDTSSYIVEAEIDEYDIPELAVGQKVVIKTNATQDDTLEGVVSFISPAASASSGGSSSSGGTSSASSKPTFLIKVQVLTKDERIKVGMTAKLNIVTSEKRNCLTVPFDAIYVNETGQKVVAVCDNPPEKEKNAADVSDGPNIEVVSEKTGSIADSIKQATKKEPVNEEEPLSRREIPVEVGMETNYYSEVISPQLQEGMTVYVDGGEDASSTDLGDAARRGRGPF